MRVANTQATALEERLVEQERSAKAVEEAARKHPMEAKADIVKREREVIKTRCS